MNGKNMEDVKIVEEPKPWLIDSDTGFEFVEQFKEEKPITSLYDYDYDFLKKRARQLGFIGGDKPKDILVNYIQNYLDELNIEPQELQILYPVEKGLHAGLRREYCTPAYSHVEAQLLIREDGMEDTMKHRIPCDGWLVSDIKIEHPSVCDIEIKWKSRHYYARRYKRAIDRLRECDAEDQGCIKNAVRTMSYYRNKIQNYPIMAHQKCFCGEFQCLQGTMAQDVYKERMQRKRAVRELKRRRPSRRRGIIGQ